MNTKLVKDKRSAKQQTTLKSKQSKRMGKNWYQLKKKLKWDIKRTQEKVTNSEEKFQHMDNVSS